MQSLGTGESPVISLRLPKELHAALIEAAGTGRGAHARYIRALIERETARGRRTPGRSQQGTTAREVTH